MLHYSSVKSQHNAEGLSQMWSKDLLSMTPGYTKCTRVLKDKHRRSRQELVLGRWALFKCIYMHDELSEHTLKPWRLL